VIARLLRGRGKFRTRVSRRTGVEGASGGGARGKKEGETDPAPKLVKAIKETRIPMTFDEPLARERPVARCVLGSSSAA
jgi:hypothetical protein